MDSTSLTAMAPLLLRNLLTSIFIIADRTLVLVDKFKLLQILRHFLVSTFLFFLQILPSFFPSLDPPEDDQNHLLTPSKADKRVPAFGGGSGNSCIARALSQLLSIMNEIPVSSRKYEIVKSLAEKLIVGNLEESSEPLRKVNSTVLSGAFSRTLSQLEVASMDQEGDLDDGEIMAKPSSIYRLDRAYRTVRYFGVAVWTRFRTSKGELNRSAEKLLAELHWLAEKLAASGSAEEAVRRWASASKLAWLALSTEGRLQGSFVRVSAFLFKQAKEMGGEGCERSKREEQIRKTKMKMLMSWLPLLCRARGGVDAPVLSLDEKSELERVLDEIIQSLRQEEEQEKVLSLWLHHFTHCPSSDWPNLLSCYERWCAASRMLLVQQEECQNLDDIGL